MKVETVTKIVATQEEKQKMKNSLSRQKKTLFICRTALIASYNTYNNRLLRVGKTEKALYIRVSGSVCRENQLHIYLKFLQHVCVKFCLATVYYSEQKHKLFRCGHACRTCRLIGSLACVFH